MEVVRAIAACKLADGATGGVVPDRLVADGTLTLGDAGGRLLHLLSDLDLPRRTAPRLCHRFVVVERIRVRCVAVIIVSLVHQSSTALRLKGGVHALKHGLESHQLGSCLLRRRCHDRRTRCPVEGSLCATTVGRSRYRAARGTATRPVRHGRTRHEA